MYVLAGPHASSWLGDLQHLVSASGDCTLKCSSDLVVDTPLRSSSTRQPSKLGANPQIASEYYGFENAKASIDMLLNLT